MTANLHDINRSLGRIEGKLDLVLGHQESMDKRLREVEKTATKNAMICSSIVSISIATISSFVKTKLGI